MEKSKTTEPNQPNQSPIPSENNGIKFVGRKKYRQQQMKELFEAIESKRSITPEKLYPAG